MYTAYERLTQYLDEHGIRYLADADVHAIFTEFRGEAGCYRLVARIEPDDGLFQVFGSASVVVPEGCRPAIAETIARANYGLKIGKFELCFDDGELRFHASQIIVDEQLDDLAINRLFGAVLWTYDAFLPAINSVIYANELPKDAIRHVELRLGINSSSEQAKRDEKDEE